MLVERIIRDKGYLPNPAKTRIMPAKTLQRITGVVVKDHVNVARPTTLNLRQRSTTARGRNGIHRIATAIPTFAHISTAASSGLSRSTQHAKLRALYEAIAWS